MVGGRGKQATDAFIDREDDDERLIHRAMALEARSQLGSTSMMWHKLKVGFTQFGVLQGCSFSTPSTNMGDNAHQRR